MIPLFLQSICSDKIYNRRYQNKFIFEFENQDVGGQ